MSARGEGTRTGGRSLVSRETVGHNSISLRFASLMLATLACAISCRSTTSEEGEWAEAEVTIASERVLRQVATIALDKNGFPPGTENVGLNSTVSSGWRVELQPFKGDGTRSKAHIQYEEKSARTWHVSVRVEKETNEELAKPLELARAKWESGPDDRDSAARILAYMRTLLGREFELGPKSVPTEAERSSGG